MSFCNNNSTIDRCPGNINGNPMNGLCEKVCIQTTKIFDACMMQTSIDQTVTLTNISPSTPTLPLTFVSGSSTSSTGTITALTITPIADRAGLSRVTATVSIPVQIAYTDANGVSGTGTSTVNITQDVVMCVPSGQRNFARGCGNRQYGFAERYLREQLHVQYHVLRNRNFERTSTRQPSRTLIRLLQDSALHGI